MAASTIIDGIEVHVTPEDFDDYEIAECLAVIAENDDPGEKPEGLMVEFMKAACSLPKLIFKDDWKRIKGELRAANGGRLPNAVVTDFVKKAMAAAKAKN